MSASDMTPVSPGSLQPVHTCTNENGSNGVPDKQSKTAPLDEYVDEGEAKAKIIDPEKETVHSPSFVVIYLGSAHLDRRFPPQSAMPWVMGEIKRSRDTFKEVCLQIQGNKLHAVCYEGTERMETVFEHNLHNLSRFAKTHQDPRCFAYLSRPSLYSDFECHAFLANEESVVSIRFFLSFSGPLCWPFRK